MPNKTFNDLSIATTSDGTELIPLVSGGVTKSITMSTLNYNIYTDAISDVVTAEETTIGQASIAADVASRVGSITQQNLTGVTSAALHRSPNAIASMFIYDTSKDSDGGAWTEKCQHTSWYNETLSGKWLGAHSSEINARYKNSTLNTELLVNGDFSNSSNGWTNTSTGTGAASIANGVATLTGVDASNRGRYTSSTFSLTANKVYMVSWSIVDGSANSQIEVTGIATDLDIYGTYGPGVYYRTFVASSTTNTYALRFNVYGAGTVVFDNISVKEVTATSTQPNDYFQISTNGNFYTLNRNLVAYSESTSGWVPMGTYAAYTDSNITLPTGVSAMALYSPQVEGNTLSYIATNSNRLYAEYDSTVLVLGNTTYTLSAYVRSYSQDTDVGIALLNRNTDTVKASSSITVSSTWTRISVTGTTDGTNTGIRVAFSSKYKVLIAGIQVEYGSSAGTYQYKNGDSGTSLTYRGNKRSFPKIAGIVAEVGNLTIYDLTESGRPMWMKFIGNTPGLIQSPFIYANGTSRKLSAVAAKNGLVNIGTTSNSGVGLIGITFAGDYATITTTAGGNRSRSPISGRNLNSVVGAGYTPTNNQYWIINNDILALAMTVLPDAPIDPATGLQVPTVAVGTAGGVSVIKHDGIISSEAFSWQVSYDGLAISGDTLWFGRAVDYLQLKHIKLSSITGSTFTATPLGTGILQTTKYTRHLRSIGGGGIAVGVAGAQPITLFKTNYNGSTKSLSAWVSSTYNTGYMTGDIRRCITSNSSGNVVGSKERPASLFLNGETGAWYDPSDINLTWRKNLVTYSEQFNNTAWIKTSINTTGTPQWIDVGTAPDGTVSADQLIAASGATSSHVIEETVSSSVYTPHTFSVYANPNGVNFLRILIGGTGWNAYCAFNVSTGSYGTTATNNGLNVSVSMTPVSGGWYRCSITATPKVGSIVNVVQIGLNNSLDPNDNSFIGDGSSGIYIWGAQLELGSTATTYQKITDGIQDYYTYQSQPIMFEDIAGTIPVASLERPVGLLLDKSKGLVLGPELVTNSTFTTDLSGWTVGTAITASAVSGEAVVNFTGSLSATTNNWFAANLPSTANKRYRIEFDATYVSGGDLQAGTDWTVGKTITGASNAGVKTKYSLDVSSQNTRALYGLVTFGATTTATWKLDNISVRELPGNHAFGSGSNTNFPKLSARYNLLTKTEDFSDAVWTKSAGASTTAWSIALATSGDYVYEAITATFPAGASYTWSAQVNSASRLITFGGATPAGTDAYSQTDLGGGVYRQTLTRTFTSPGTSVTIQAMFGAGQPAGSGTFAVSKADLRVTNDALNQPSYQRVNTSTDYDTAGFKPYLSFNGVNQWLQTNSIDFTYSDKMFVCAGVRKLGIDGIVVELSQSTSTNNGAFLLYTPNTAYRFDSKGSAQSIAAGGSGTPPVTSVISGIGNISGDQSILRVNGTQAAISTADQGTGNYGNYPLYIGARAGSSLWFNGRLYGLIVRGYKNTDSQITDIESWMNTKTNAY